MRGEAVRLASPVPKTEMRPSRRDIPVACKGELPEIHGWGVAGRVSSRAKMVAHGNDAIAAGAEVFAPNERNERNERNEPEFLAFFLLFNGRQPEGQRLAGAKSGSLSRQWQQSALVEARAVHPNRDVAPPIHASPTSSHSARSSNLPVDRPCVDPLHVAQIDMDAQVIEVQ